MFAKESWPTFKRFILIGLTILALINITLSLIQSWQQPQVQSRLELYQTDLLLQAAEFKADNAQTQQVLETALGETPYESAREEYAEARTEVQNSLVVAKDGAKISERERLEARNFLEQIDLKLGILQAQEGKVKEAQQRWAELGKRARNPQVASTATILESLWAENATAEPAPIAPVLEQNLEGWFRDRAIEQLYRIQQNREGLAQLAAERQMTARAALTKLAIVSGLPAFCGLLGVILLLFLAARTVWQPQKSLLTLPETLAWQVPWDGETIWQVLIVGFFFAGQFLLPLFFGFLGLDPTGYNVREKAFLVLASYLLLAAVGLSVLYVSIKPYFPLPTDWFRFEVRGNWFLWGLGGYLIAVPVVVVVSLINQQLWNGQGGSNPILSLALQAQDWVALGVFIFTASVAAPVFEEIIFRGFLLPSLTRYLPVWAAVATSALVFATAHLSLSEVLPLTALGGILGVVYARSRNLLASILLHSFWNSGTLLTLFVLGR
ncbi:CPBP family intramembrane glutamic endopeptidase [Oscillatoria sp. FACHB-1406]|uniref:CPBP family intramembrane glutamic endopeptidase n=1 Tax=Oscillatoria sp. FACHB-1406 TaxID=2692846 RepID=UPI001685D32B|nr:CPBP family intramembrane glutamic endopeptidase [Oscillatoria sp. FACHB-1406]MBD2580044.1 CPBP family intramembrane metalloprotease [Oscillatoria sp. FACHB-1406]